MTGIDITTGSRLHFGLICSPPAANWRFGGIGVMLRHPAWHLSVTPISADLDVIRASDITSQRIHGFLRSLRSRQNVKALQIEVLEEMSFHTGLGSGTQLGLALSAAVELMTHRRVPEDTFQLAQRVDRAERSAIGTAGFARGGFLIDHGESSGTQSRQIDRVQFPDEWRFVVLKPVDSQGLSGEQEQFFFKQGKSMPAKLIADIEKQILQQVVPSVREQRFDTFAKALENYGQTVGAYYAAEQGGVFAHPVMRQLVVHLRENNVAGMAQSSWGPLIGIPAESQEHAESILQVIPSMIDSSRLSAVIVEPLNTGATIRSTVDDAVGRGLV
jgi:beta-ribofuranosylaminobenzene 5'-phosphate synthase